MTPDETSDSQEKYQVKAEILRQAQLRMLRGEVRIENGHLIGPNSDDDVVLPAEITIDSQSFQHPYYWAGFILIGSPW